MTIFCVLHNAFLMNCCWQNLLPLYPCDCTSMCSRPIIMLSPSSFTSIPTPISLARIPWECWGWEKGSMFPTFLFLLDTHFRLFTHPWSFHFQLSIQHQLSWFVHCLHPSPLNAHLSAHSTPTPTSSSTSDKGSCGLTSSLPRLGNSSRTLPYTYPWTITHINDH